MPQANKVTPNCTICKHYLRDLTCKAFPDRIPLPIVSGEFLHDQPFDGDRGIRFEPIADLTGNGNSKPSP